MRKLEIHEIDICLKIQRKGLQMENETVKGRDITTGHLTSKLSSFFNTSTGRFGLFLASIM